MTRFKELRRIKTAIAKRNASDLKWALGYCKMRIGISGEFSKSAAQEKHWRKILRDVEEAMRELNISN